MISINPIIRSIYYAPKNEFKNANFKGHQKDVFEKRQDISFLGVPFGLDDSIKAKAANISKDEIESEIKHVVGPTKQAARETYKIAKLTEEMLDEKYGENNWIFVSIGTSPAGIGKALELRGHDVRYVPISELRCIDDLTLLNIDVHPEYMKFLNSIGLRKNKINKDDKHYIIADYTHSGNTINRIKKWSYSRGLSHKNTHFISLNDELQNYAESKNDIKLRNKIYNYFEYYCMYELMENYAGVPHIPYYETYLIDSKIRAPQIQTTSEKGFETALCYYHIKDTESKQN